MLLSPLKLLICLCCVVCTKGLPDIREFFSSLTGYGGDNEGNEIIHDKPNIKRVKRQSINLGDSSSLTHIAKSSVLHMRDNKVDLRYMPTLSNGHIGFTPFGDSIYMNGLYNGVGADSHRAKIPAVIMGKMYIGTPADERKWRVNRHYSLDAETGVWMEEIDSDFLYAQHRLYVHQKYNRLFVSDFYAKAKYHTLATGGNIKIHYPNISSIDIIGFNNIGVSNTDKLVDGETREAEVGSKTQKVSVFWMDGTPQIDVRGVGESVNRTYIMAIDKDKSIAQDEFKIAQNILFSDADRGPMKLLREHEKAWRDTWAMGKLEVEGDLTLQKIVQFSQYYLLSNVPSYFPYIQHKESDYIYGVGRQGLGKGGKGEDQQGHVFWDSEMYILPALLPFHPKKAKDILKYRSQKLIAARSYAEQNGEKGARFPWESAFGGSDVTPGICQGCKERQIHVGAGIAYGIRLYYSMTRDRDYIINSEYNGCDMTKAIADYYAEKAVYNNDDGRYHITDVMGPDDLHDHQSNDAYTNAAISLALHYARYMACQCARPEREEIPDEYIQKAMYLKLPYDHLAKLHYQSDEYQGLKEENKTVKQASVVLMGFPLNWNMSRDIQKNDLEYYDKLTDSDTPAMTKSFMAVGFKTIDDKSRTLTYFASSYEDYVVQPFKIWTEYSESASTLTDEERKKSTVNFLPGMGAFLQSIVYGFAGLRIRPEMIEFHDPKPPEGLTLVRLKQFSYLGAKMTITIHGSPARVEIEVHEVEQQFPLVLVRNNTWGRGPEESLKPGPIVTIDNPKQGFYIYSSKGTACDHPRDYIFMPWGYSPFINTAQSVKSSTTSLLLCVLVIFASDCYRFRLLSGLAGL